MKRGRELLGAVPVFLGPSVAATLWWGFSLTVLGSRPGALLGLACGFLGVLLLLCGAVARLHAPDGYPLSRCPPGNVLPWWPDRVPL